MQHFTFYTFYLFVDVESAGEGSAELDEFLSVPQTHILAAVWVCQYARAKPNVFLVQALKWVQCT